MERPAEAEPIETPEALELPWTPIIAMLLVMIVIAIVTYALLKIRKEAAG
jgi:hypothetical protein